MTAIGPGSVVVCVSDNDCPELTVGRRYVVREICRHDPGVHLVPGVILQWPDPGPEYCCYDSELFRPIDDRDTQIFTDILADIPERVEA